MKDIAKKTTRREVKINENIISTFSAGCSLPDETDGLRCRKHSEKLEPRRMIHAFTALTSPRIINLPRSLLYGEKRTARDESGVITASSARRIGGGPVNIPAPHPRVPSSQQTSESFPSSIRLCHEGGTCTHHHPPLVVVLVPISCEGTWWSGFKSVRNSISFIFKHSCHVARNGP